MFDKIKSAIGSVKKLAAWAKSVPSEQNGTGSSSRVIALTCTAAAVGAFVFHVYVNRSLPTNDHMYGLGVLLGAGHAPYVANQMRSAKTDAPQPVVLQGADGSTQAVGFVTESHDPDEGGAYLRPRPKGR